MRTNGKVRAGGYKRQSSAVTGQCPVLSAFKAGSKVGVLAKNKLWEMLTPVTATNAPGAFLYYDVISFGKRNFVRQKSTFPPMHSPLSFPSLSLHDAFVVYIFASIAIIKKTNNRQSWQTNGGNREEKRK